MLTMAIARRGWLGWAMGLAVVGLAFGVWGVLGGPSALAQEGGGEPVPGQENPGVILVYVPRIILVEAKGDVPLYFKFVDGESIEDADWLNEVVVLDATVYLELMGTTHTIGTYGSANYMRSGDCVSGDGNNKTNAETAHYTVFVPLEHFDSILSPISDNRHVVNDGTNHTCRFYLEVRWTAEGKSEKAYTNKVDFSAYGDNRIEAVNLGCPPSVYPQGKDEFGVHREQTLQGWGYCDTLGEEVKDLYSVWNFRPDPESHPPVTYFLENEVYDQLFLGRFPFVDGTKIDVSLFMDDWWHGTDEGDEANAGPYKSGLEGIQLGAYTVAYYSTKPNSNITVPITTFGGGSRPAVIDVRQKSGSITLLLLKDSTASFTCVNPDGTTVDWATFVSGGFFTAAGIFGILAPEPFSTGAGFCATAGGLAQMYAAIGPEPDEEAGGDFHLLAAYERTARDGTADTPVFCNLGELGSGKYVYHGEPSPHSVGAWCHAEKDLMIAGDTLKAMMVFGGHIYDKSAGGFFSPTHISFHMELTPPAGTTFEDASSAWVESAAVLTTATGERNLGE